MPPCPPGPSQVPRPLSKAGATSESRPPSRRKHDHARALEAVRARQWVAVHAADALQQHVHRAEVGDQQIGVDVEGLFQRLRPDHDAARARARRIDAQRSFHGRIEELAVLDREAAVMKGRETGCPHEQRLASRGVHGLPGSDRRADGVPNDEHPSASARFGDGAVGRDRGVHRRHGTRVHGLPGPACPGSTARPRVPFRPHRRVGSTCRVFERRHMRLIEPPSSCSCAEGRRHQHGVSSGVEVSAQQPLDYRSHVGVRGVHLVDHEQTSAQRAATQMRVLHLERGEHRLVHGTDGDRRGEKARGVLPRPSVRAPGRGDRPRGRASRATHGRRHLRLAPCPEWPAPPRAPRFHTRAAARQRCVRAVGGRPRAWVPRSTSRTRRPRRADA